jgi:putative colanic acid biosynthesis glycosyltransferase
MLRLLQINTVCNAGSTGRIAENIGKIAMSNNWESYIAYGRGENNNSSSETYKIGTKVSLYNGALSCRFFDNDGFCNIRETKLLIRYINRINPDIIHIHNLHGYYLNLELLIPFIASLNIPIVFTLHDCWTFTGHCTNFDYVDCEKWKTQCFSCPQKSNYPSSLFLDQSYKNYRKKKELFNLLDNVHIVTPSLWLSQLVVKSYLKNFPVSIINNGIDLQKFHKRDTSELRRKLHLEGKKVVLGVAGDWDKHKGLEYLIQVSSLLPKDYKFIVIGGKKGQKKNVPSSFINIDSTKDIVELSMYYSLADVYVNPTEEDNFPTTNLEALACGTPIALFDTGGSAESIGSSCDCGIKVEKNDLIGLKNAILAIISKGKSSYMESCIKRVSNNFSASKQFKNYIELYNSLLK